MTAGDDTMVVDRSALEQDCSHVIISMVFQALSVSHEKGGV